MEKKKEITAEAAFNETKVYMDQYKDDIELTEFRNRMRQGMTSNWKCDGAGTSIESWQGYGQKLEKILFDLLNTK